MKKDAAEDTAMNDSGSRVFVFQKSDCIVPGDAGTLAGIDGARFCSAFPGLVPYRSPFLSGGGFLDAVLLEDEAAIPEGWKALPLRSVLSLFVSSGGGIQGNNDILRAYHLVQWRRASLYCGRCGAKNTDHPEELARLCPVCGGLEFPRIAPAVISVVTRGDKILLAHNVRFINKVYSLIAGFVEAGETLEDTVSREIQEEVGLEVDDIRYITSQPWPFPHSLMLGFSARCTGGTIQVDGKEIEDARWFSRDDLPGLSQHGSISRYLIDRWAAGTL
ncbi:MAG: NAD(+) diphosphatase [Spirochaetaceae bacterium]|nr:NAD(+) diphosphatase [Spirochaetaceae bacterium]